MFLGRDEFGGRWVWKEILQMNEVESNLNWVKLEFTFESKKSSERNESRLEGVEFGRSRVKMKAARVYPERLTQRFNSLMQPDLEGNGDSQGVTR